MSETQNKITTKSSTSAMSQAQEKRTPQGGGDRDKEAHTKSSASTMNKAQEEKTVRSLSELPRDIIIKILSSAANRNIKSINRCRCVCKGWRELLLIPNFLRLQYSLMSASADCILLYTPRLFYRFGEVQHSGLLQFQNEEDDDGSPSFNLSAFSLEFDFTYCSTRLLGSCNGLLCFSQKRTRLFVANPHTREYVYLPLQRSSTKESIYGFGFNPKTNQYKVINLFTDQYDAPNMWRAKVHTLGAGKWRNIGIVPYMFSSQPNTYLKGTLYWVVSSSVSMGPNYSICSFNLETEEFKTLASLPQVCQQHRHKSTLGVFRDSICVVCDVGSVGFSLNAEIWVLKEKIHHKTKEFFWTKELVFEKRSSAIAKQDYPARWHCLQLIKVLENGAILFKYSPRFIICYDPRDRSSRCLRVDVDDMVVHVPSFISLKDIASGNKWNVINEPYSLYKLQSEANARARAKLKPEIQWEPLI